MYNPELAKRPQIIAANKTDMPSSEDNLRVFREKFEAWLSDQGESVQEGLALGAWRIFEICAPIAHGTEELMRYVGSVLDKMPLPEMEVPTEEHVVYSVEEDETPYSVAVTEDGVYEVTGRWIKSVVDSTNLYDTESAQYFQRLIRKKGLVDELERLGIQDGDLVRIYETEFEYYK